jgi:transcriptional regulator with XRE-family HTH domain
MLGLVMPLKDKLKELRKAADLTQQQLANRAGLSMTAVVHIESGRIKDPRMSTLKAIAQVLGVTVNDLITDTGEPNAEESPAPKRPRKRKGK